MTGWARDASPGWALVGFIAAIGCLIAMNVFRSFLRLFSRNN